MNDSLGIIDAMYPGPRTPREWWVCVNEFEPLDHWATLFSTQEAAEAFCAERRKEPYWGTYFVPVHMVEILKTGP